MSCENVSIAFINLFESDDIDKMISCIVSAQFSAYLDKLIDSAFAPPFWHSVVFLVATKPISSLN